MKIALAYFSPTGNTGKVAQAVAEALAGLGASVDMVDVTALKSREKPLDLSPYQAVVFGSPIHSLRAPRVVREWMQTLDGAGKKASMFFTYGGFLVHPSHYSTRKILAGRGFSVVSSAEFLGAHTFNIGGWQAVPNRPDNGDFALAREYAAATYKRFSGQDAAILGDLEQTQLTEEFLDSIEAFRFKVLSQLPTRNGEECSMCMECQEQCPTGAMDAATGEADREKCIACLACVALCPENALQINDMSGSFAAKLQMDKTTPEDIAKKQGKIYL